jgi:hypothetical protein
LELREVIKFVDRLTALCFTVSSVVHVWEFMICQQWAAVIGSIGRFSQLQLVSSVFRQGAVYFRAMCISV